jgi:hypothetical protein
MGARETTPAATHARGNQRQAHPYPPASRRRLLVPHDRPPLADIQLVRPRPRRSALAAGAPAGTPDRAAAQSSSDKQSQNNSHTQPRRPKAGHRVTSPRPLDNSSPHVGRCGRCCQRVGEVSLQHDPMISDEFLFGVSWPPFWRSTSEARRSPSVRARASRSC